MISIKIGSDDNQIPTYYNNLYYFVRMGSELSKQDPNIQIYTELSKHLYVSGQQIHGNVYLNALKDADYDALYIQFEGVQYVMWNQGLPNRKKLYTNKRQSYLDQFQIFDFTRNLPRGQYNFPFSFTLPNSLPGSLCFSENQYIKYFISAYLKHYDQKDIMPMHITSINVIQPFRGQIGPIILNGVTQLPGCCWQINKTKIYIYCHQNFAKTGEKIKIDAKVDNAEGSLLEECKFVLNANTYKVSNSNISKLLFYPFDLYIPKDRIIQKKTQKAYSFEASIPENINRSTSIGNILALYYTISFSWKGFVLNGYQPQMHIIINSQNPKLILPQKIKAPSNWNPKIFQKKIITNIKPYIYQPSASMPYTNQIGFQNIIQMQQNMKIQQTNHYNKMEITQQDIGLEQHHINY